MKQLTEKHISFIKKSLEKILLNEFGSGYKSKVLDKPGRFNFACPICGDSLKDERKKRGNLYLNTGMFHCYNDGCPSKHLDIISFLKYFNIVVDDLDDLIFILDFINENKEIIQTKDPSDILSYGVFKTLSELSIYREELKKVVGFQEISQKHKKIWWYLNKRLLINKKENFLYYEPFEQLCFLNLYKDKIIGYQVRNFKSTAKDKYVSYNIEKIYKDYFNKDISNIQEIQKINTLSLYFGIFDVDFTKPFTIFEGPSDSFLWPKNKVALAGVEKDSNMFDDNPNARYFLDNDKAGRSIMEEKLQKKKTVFLWRKFIEDYKIKDNIKDFNDLIVWCYSNNKNAISELKNYWSNHPLDIYYV